MDAPVRQERPNTVDPNLEAAGLRAYRQALHKEVRKVSVDIVHVEAAIRLFDPDNSPAAFKRYVTQHRARKGTQAVRAGPATGRYSTTDCHPDHRRLARGSRPPHR